MHKKRVSDLLQIIQEQISPVYPIAGIRRQNAWWMLEALTKMNKAHLITAEHIELSTDQQTTLDEWIYKQVHNHMPLQYILGSVPFDNLDIIVQPPILIPRQETEWWCMHVIYTLKKTHINNLTILDLCSGSGCIGLALADAFPDATVYAVDISPHAVALGQLNAQHNNITNITFIESDLFTALPKDIRFDIIVSNPPYIPDTQWQTLDLSVSQWEDHQALIADDAGLAIIKKIIAQAPQYLKTDPLLTSHKIPQLIIEIDSPQAELVKQLYQDAGFVNIATKKDLEERERIVIGSLPDVANTKHHQ